jgi:hypothetical protein
MKIEMKYPRECVDELLAALRDDHRAPDRFRPLPEADTLAALLDVAFAASMAPEEGRFATFGLAFVSPQAAPPSFKAVRFAQAHELSKQEVVNLAAATDAATSSLAIWAEPGSTPRMWGLVTSPAPGHPTFIHAPFLLVRARAPGVLYVYYRRELHLLYVRGVAHFRPPSQLLETILRDKVGLTPIAATALGEIATRISLLGHGGTILLTSPSDEIAGGLLDVSYRFDPPNMLLRDAVGDTAGLLDRPAERHALDFVAQLSQIDGAVHLTSDLAIHGFGAMIRSNTDEFPLLAEDPGGDTKHDLPLSTIPGTRHRSAAMFCAQQPGHAFAIVISQDGDVSLFSRRLDDSVLRIGPFAFGAGLAVGE